MENNYGEAIRNNTGSKAIWAIFKHRIISKDESLESQHDLFPRDGWCLFWKKSEKYNNKERLPSCF